MYRKLGFLSLSFAAFFVSAAGWQDISIGDSVEGILKKYPDGRFEAIPPEASQYGIQYKYLIESRKIVDGVSYRFQTHHNVQKEAYEILVFPDRSAGFTTGAISKSIGSRMGAPSVRDVPQANACAGVTNSRNMGGFDTEPAYTFVDKDVTVVVEKPQYVCCGDRADSEVCQKVAGDASGLRITYLRRATPKPGTF